MAQRRPDPGLVVNGQGPTAPSLGRAGLAGSAPARFPAAVSPQLPIQNPAEPPTGAIKGRQIRGITETVSGWGELQGPGDARGAPYYVLGTSWACAVLRVTDGRMGNRRPERGRNSPKVTQQVRGGTKVQSQVTQLPARAFFRPHGSSVLKTPCPVAPSRGKEDKGRRRQRGVQHQLAGAGTDGSGSPMGLPLTA